MVGVGGLITTYPVKRMVIFFSAAYNPDRWATHYLHQETTSWFPFLKTPQVQWINKRKPMGESKEESRSKKRRLSPPSHPMQSSHKNRTYVYFCRRNKDMASKDKTYPMAEYFPCYGQLTNDKKYLVPLLDINELW